MKKRMSKESHKESHRLSAIPLRLDPKMRAALRREAKQSGSSVSKLLRDTIARLLRVCPTCGKKRS